MATTVFPEASAATGGSDTLAKTVSVVSPQTIVKATANFSVGTYLISCVSTTIATVDFFQEQLF